MMRCFPFFTALDAQLRARVLPLDVARRRLAESVDDLADDLVAALGYYMLPETWRPHAHAHYMDCLCAVTVHLPPDLVPPGKITGCHQWWLTGGRVDEALVRAAVHAASGTAGYWAAVRNMYAPDNAEWESDTARMRKTMKLLRRCHQAQGTLRAAERGSLRAALKGQPWPTYDAYAY